LLNKKIRITFLQNYMIHRGYPIHSFTFYPATQRTRAVCCLVWK